MRKTATLSARITPALDAKLEKLAKRQGRTKSQLVSVAIAAYLEADAKLEASIREARADAKSGRVTPHGEIMAQIARAAPYNSVENDAEYRAAIDRGLADIAAGRKFTTKQVIASAKARLRARRSPA